MIAKKIWWCAAPKHWKIKIASTRDEKNPEWPEATRDFFSSQVLSI